MASGPGPARRADEAVLLLEDAATFLTLRLGPGHPDVVAATADLLSAQAMEPELTSR